jgi:hypothetical protein
MSLVQSVARLYPELCIFGRVYTPDEVLREMESGRFKKFVFVKEGRRDQKAWWSKIRRFGKPLCYYEVYYDDSLHKWCTDIKLYSRTGDSSSKSKCAGKRVITRGTPRDFVNFMRYHYGCFAAVVPRGKEEVGTEEDIANLVQHPSFGIPRIFTTGIDKNVGPQLMCDIYTTAIKKHIQGGNQTIFAFDPHWAKDTGGKAYLNYSNAKDLWRDLVSKMDRNKRHFYQWIKKDTPCCFFMDIEWYPQKSPEKNEPEVLQGVLKYIGEAMKHYFNVDLPDYEIIVATTKDKVSWHMWFPTLFFEDNNVAMKRFMDFLVVKEIRRRVELKDELAILLYVGVEAQPSVIDQSVYSTHRIWRVYGQSKLKEPDRPFLPIGRTYDQEEEEIGIAMENFSKSFLSQPSMEELRNTPGVLLVMTEMMPESWGVECGLTRSGEARRKVADSARRNETGTFESVSITLDQMSEKKRNLVKLAALYAKSRCNRSNFNVSKLKYSQKHNSAWVTMLGKTNGKEIPENAFDCIGCKETHYSDNPWFNVHFSTKTVQYSCFRNKRKTRLLRESKIKQLLGPQKDIKKGE